MIAALILAVAFFWPSPVLSAPAAGLPAIVLQSAPIPGRPSDRVEVYVQGGTFLAIISSQTPDRPVWTRRVVDQPVRLVIPGEPGVFALLVKASAHEGLLAFEFDGRHVKSAIAGKAAGTVSGDEGVRWMKAGFRVLRSDRAHVGSVKYRLVTRYAWAHGLFTPAPAIQVPDYPPTQYPRPNAVFKTGAGSRFLLRLEVASTPAEQETGLMYRQSLDPDSGMLFLWNSPVLISFWMENTYIPLTVAFIGANHRIQEMQDMQPLTTTNHMPLKPYQYAIEANLGYFTQHGIKVGDTVLFDLRAAATKTPPQ